MVGKERLLELLSLQMTQTECAFLDALMESQARILKRNLRRRGPDHNDNKANKRKQMSDILFILNNGLLLLTITESIHSC